LKKTRKGGKGQEGRGEYGGIKTLGGVKDQEKSEKGWSRGGVGWSGKRAVANAREGDRQREGRA